MSGRPRGYSLIELMIVITIMAVLLAAGIPFTRYWVDGQKQMQARNTLWEAVSQTRALAMRNPGHMAADETAATLQLADHALSIHAARLDATQWSAKLPADAAANFADAAGNAGNALTCVAFNNRGQRLPAAADCATPASQHRIAITLRDQDPLYVDLL